MKVATELAREFVTLDVVAGQPVSLRHGFGRPPTGWLVLWSTAPVQFHVVDPMADARTELVLIPTVTAQVRLVVL